MSSGKGGCNKKKKHPKFEVKKNKKTIYNKKLTNLCLNLHNNIIYIIYNNFFETV